MILWVAPLGIALSAFVLWRKATQRTLITGRPYLVGYTMTIATGRAFGDMTAETARRIRREEGYRVITRQHGKTQVVIPAASQRDAVMKGRDLGFKYGLMLLW